MLELLGGAFHHATPQQPALLTQFQIVHPVLIVLEIARFAQ
jgi:hypothetical protein